MITSGLVWVCNIKQKTEIAGGRYRDLSIFPHFWLFVKSWGKIFLRHRNDVSVSLYVRDKKIRFLKFSKFRYPKALRLMTLMALFVPSVYPFV